MAESESTSAQNAPKGPVDMTKNTTEVKGVGIDPSSVPERKNDSGDLSTTNGNSSVHGGSAGTNSAKNTIANDTHPSPRGFGTVDAGSTASRKIPVQMEAIASVTSAPLDQSLQHQQQAHDEETQPRGQPQYVEGAHQQQQTVVYQVPQIPSVVTLSVDVAQDCCAVSTLPLDLPQEALPKKEGQQGTQPQAQNTNPRPQSQPPLTAQSEDQIIGMVGAIPIIKMQGVDMPNVKKKKGRFKLLDETPVIPNVVGIVPTITSGSSQQSSSGVTLPVTTTAASSSHRSQSPNQGSTIGSTNASTVQTGPQTFDGISAPTVKRKGRFVVTNVKDPSSIIQIQTKPTPSVAATTISEATVPTPVVTVVTTPSVDNNTVVSRQTQEQQQSQEHDPPLPPPVPQQQPPVQHPPSLSQPQIQSQTSRASIHHQQLSPHPNQRVPFVQHTFHEPTISHVPVQPVVLQPVSTMQPTTYSIPHQYSQVPVAQYPQQLPPQTVQYTQIPPQYIQYIPSVHQHRRGLSNQSTFSSTSEPKTVLIAQEPQYSHQTHYPAHLQQNTIDVSTQHSFSSGTGPKTVIVEQEHHVPYSQPQTISTQQYVPNQPSIGSQRHRRQASSASLVTTNQQMPTAQSSHNTPPTTPGGSSSSPLPTRSTTNSSLPNAPIPKPPTSATAEKTLATKTGSKKKTTIQGRSGKVPQSFDSNGTYSSIGLGKAFYLLDQMKTEVTDADHCIKTLQTDMKLLRDKNKELEAKNKDLDGKLKEEQALREKSELRSKELRKKLREAMEELKAMKQPSKSTSEEKDTSRNKPESGTEKVGNGSKETKPSTTGKVPLKTKPSGGSATINGASPIRHTIESDAVASSSNANGIPKSTTPLTPMTPKTKGSIANSKHFPPKMDLGSKDASDQTNPTDGTNRKNRSRSFAKETEPRGTVEASITSNPMKEKPQTMHRKNESLSTMTTPPLIPPLRPNNGIPKSTVMNGHKHSNSLHSLHDFDPLKSTVPVISFPTALSFDNLTLKNAATTQPSSLSHDLSATHVTQNPLVVPLTIGVTPTAVRNTTEVSTEHHHSPAADRQPFVTNQYHTLQQPQQFMVVPQQQPIVLNQMGGSVQQEVVDHTFSTPLRTANNISHQQYSGGAFHHQQRQTFQHDLHQQQFKQQQPSQSYSTSTGHPFDPYLS